MDEEIDNGFTADEAAYFESEGENIAPSLGGDGISEADPAHTDAPDPDAQEAGEKDAEKKGGTVPHGALHAEREEHKKTKAILDEVQRTQAVLNDRWNTLLLLQNGGTQPTAETKPAEDTPPDPAADFLGYVMWQGREMQRRQAQEDQERQQSETERAEAQVWGAWDYSVAQARAAKPDFDQATQFLSDMREKQLEALAVVNPQFGDVRGRVAQINVELKDIVRQAGQLGRDPAELIYQMAQSFGYAPHAAPSDPQNIQQQTLDKVAALDEAQRASRTLGASSGTNTGDPLTAEAIANMSPTEFTAWMADPKNERLFDKLMGGDNA
ncbi:hypothetical protein [Ochrobactrum sp. AN78]|uniref:hypothetical protein n=1 Tax=Ochrobactrum sp. AN78 TaxID=3039853 RepID=UPI002989A5E5|nr:hypothetical protein [Ochrobactrum sp. AN78]MDH7790723.1 hypothetical protein [Ochrobactrum sp. AN78]